MTDQAHAQWHTLSVKLQNQIERIRLFASHPTLKTGCVVRVDLGPLAGVTGILTRFKGPRRLMISVLLLGRASEIEVDVDSVEIVQPAPVSGHQ